MYMYLTRANIRVLPNGYIVCRIRERAKHKRRCRTKERYTVEKERVWWDREGAVRHKETGLA